MIPYRLGCIEAFHKLGFEGEVMPPGVSAQDWKPNLYKSNLQPSVPSANAPGWSQASAKPLALSEANPAAQQQVGRWIEEARAMKPAVPAAQPSLLSRVGKGIGKALRFAK